MAISRVLISKLKKGDVVLLKAGSLEIIEKVVISSWCRDAWRGVVYKKYYSPDDIDSIIVPCSDTYTDYIRMREFNALLKDIDLLSI